MLRTLMKERDVTLKKSGSIGEAKGRADFALPILCTGVLLVWALHSQIGGGEPSPPLHGALLDHSPRAFWQISTLCTLSHVYLLVTTERAFASLRILKLLRSVTSPWDSYCECWTKRWHNSVRPWHSCSRPQRGVRLTLNRGLPSIPRDLPNLRVNLHDSARPGMACLWISSHT